MLALVLGFVCCKNTQIPAEKRRENEFFSPLYITITAEAVLASAELGNLA
jgi:hypothetical protein